MRAKCSSLRLSCSAILGAAGEVVNHRRSAGLPEPVDLLLAGLALCLLGSAQPGIANGAHG